MQSIKVKQGVKDLTNRQVHLLEYRNNFVRDYLNKATRHIVNYCLDHQIGKVVVGHHIGWKNNINNGKKNNQKFVQIPHSLFIKKLENMCERYGIQFSKQEESFTSKASYLDHDPIPTLKEHHAEKHTFSGKRIERGLYQTKEARKVNADSNAAANILRKSNHKFHLEEVARGILTFPTRIQLLTPKRVKTL